MSLRVLILCFVVLLCDAAEAPKSTLVQSVPAGIPLADPELPFAKDVWVEMIRGARKSVNLAEFYVTNRPGSALEPVLAALEEAGARGVKVRILLSSKMLGQDPASVARLKAIPGAEFRSFDLAGVSHGILHAKYFLVDDREAFVGSQNLDWRALEQIHELGVRTSEPGIVRKLTELFALDWRFAQTGTLPALPPTPDPPSGPVELLASPSFLTPRDIRPALSGILSLLAEAKSSLQIQLLTYAPFAGRDQYWPVLDGALRAAAVRGVQVRLLVSDWGLGGPAEPHLKSLAMIPNLSVRVVTFPEAQEGHIPYARTIHSKYVVVDGRDLLLSTSNWEAGYFNASRNVEVLFRDTPMARQAARIHDRLWTSTYAYALDPLKAYPRKKVD